MIRGLVTLFKWSLVAVVVIAFGSELLRSATLIALASRHGNLQPLLVVAMLSLSLNHLPHLLRKRRTVLRRPFSQILDTSADVSAGYLCLVFALSGLQFGLLGSSLSLTLAALALSIVRWPDRMIETVETLGITVPRTWSIPRGQTTGGHDGATVLDATSGLRMAVIRIPMNAASAVVSLLRERPRLPVSVTRFGSDLYAVTSARDPESWVCRFIQMLTSAGVSGASRPSPLLERAVLGMPAIDTMSGLLLSDYVIVTDPDTVGRLLESWPHRMTLHPHPDGLRAVLRSDDAAGIDVMNIPTGSENRVLVLRDISAIGREVSGIES